MLKEREKIFPTEQCKNDENRIRNKEVMTFWNFMFFPKTLLDQSLMNIQMSELMMSSPHNFLLISYTDMTKISYFRYENIKLALITTHNKWEIMFTLIYVDMGIWFYQYELKIKKFRNFIYNTYEKLWGHDIINSFIWIFIRTGQEMFSEKMWNFKMSQLPYFLSDLDNFCTNL